MKQRATLTAGTVLLLAGIIAIYLKSSPPGTQAGDAKTGTPAAGTAGGSATPGSDNPSAPADTKTATRARARDVKNKELVDQYGESRTKLASTVSTNVVAVLTDVIEIGEKAISGEGRGPFGSRAGMGFALGKFGNDLKLTTEQQDKATAAYQAFQRRELDRSKAAIERIKSDPTSLMKLMLGSDAASRGDMDDDAYKQLQSTSATELKGVLNPLDEKNFRGGKPLRDEAFVSDLRSTLDPTQAQALDAELAKQAAEPAPDANAGNISTIPKTSLEKMDQTITSVRQMTIGFKSLMEGMSGLENLRPPQEDAEPKK